MSLKLVRLDDRLIHGQVVVGWGHALSADQILLIDDDVTANEWEQELYRMGVPPGMEVEFCSVADAEAALGRWVESPKRTIVLIADVDALDRVCRTSDAVRQVNIGGIHEGAGRSRRLRYVYLSEHEAATLRSLSYDGIEVTAQDVPTARPVPLEEIA